nr:MAG TPA: hypothetical protein [Caudoviricetes sp.]
MVQIKWINKIFPHRILGFRFSRIITHIFI